MAEGFPVWFFFLFMFWLFYTLHAAQRSHKPTTPADGAKEAKLILLMMKLSPAVGIGSRIFLSFRGDETPASAKPAGKWPGSGELRLIRQTPSPKHGKRAARSPVPTQLHGAPGPRLRLP